MNHTRSFHISPDRMNNSETIRYLWVYNLGKVRYYNAWRLQKALVEKRARDQICDVLLLAEHNEVLTCGKALLSGGTSLKKISGLPFHFVERGGSETYHGPGQMMGYPIIKLTGTERDINRYLRNLEEIIIRTVNDLGLAAKRNNDHTGVWVGDKKIASIGIAVRKWVTYHGFAINLSPDLSRFHLIRPCGLDPGSISSIKQLTGQSIDREYFIQLCLKHCGEVLSREMVISDEEMEV